MDFPLYPEAYRIGYIIASILIVFQVLMQVPWLGFLYTKIRDVDRKKRTLERVHVSEEISDSVNVLKNYRHDERRLKLFVGITLSELMIGFLHFVGDILWRLIRSYHPGDCSILYRIVRLYAHIVIGNVLSVYCYTLTLLLLDILVRYHIRFYTTNNQSYTLRYQVKRVIKFSIVILVLAVSGVGVLLAHVISVVTMLIMYYRLIMNTNRLFTILRIKCDDLRYMFGEDHATTKEFVHSTKQFKRFKIWFILCGVPLILYILSGFFISLPLSLVTEQCVIDLTYLRNSTVINSPAFNITVTVVFYIILSFLFCTLLMFVPTLIVYSLIYFCDKMLFEYRYAHRYHIERSFSGNLILKPLVN